LEYNWQTRKANETLLVHGMDIKNTCSRM